MGEKIDTYYDGLDLGKGSHRITIESIGETWNINFADSAASKHFKIGTGTGESRLFIGQKTEQYIIKSFFDSKSFFFNIQELLKYLKEAEGEYYYPTQPYLYKDDLRSIYSENTHQLLISSKRIIGLRFRITIDPKRCYLVLDPLYRKDYQLFRDVCVPRMTEIVFEKYYDNKNHSVFIKMTPYFKF